MGCLSSVWSAEKEKEVARKRKLLWGFLTVRSFTRSKLPLTASLRRRIFSVVELHSLHNNIIVN